MLSHGLGLGSLLAHLGKSHTLELTDHRPAVKSYVSDMPPCTLSGLFELVRREYGTYFQLKRTPRPAEIILRPAKTNAVKSCYPINHTNTMLTALGRVFSLLQGLGGYTRGCADTPPWKELHKF